MVPLYYATISLGFAGFDELPLIVGNVKLKAVLKYREGQVRAAMGQDMEVQVKGRHPSLTGFRGSSTSRMLRFSRGMIPLGSLS